MEKIDIRKLSKIGVSNPKQKASSKTEKVKLRIGVFFDGTGNNSFNSDRAYYKHYKDGTSIIEDQIKTLNVNVSFSPKPDSNSSYWNSYSNIALLYNLYKEEQIDKTEQVPYYSIQLKTYIQGIGTLEDKPDEPIGSGFGEGPRGVISRVDEASNKIAERIKTSFDKLKSNKKIEIESIQFDVFGFSRGAAAARHFCNEVLKTGYDISPRNRDTIPTNLLKSYAKTNTNPETSISALGKEKKNVFKKKQDAIRIANRNYIPLFKIFTGGKLGEALKERKIPFPKYNVKVEFLGLFDTVISQMLERKGVIDTARNPTKSTIISTLLNPLLPLVGPALVKAVGLIPKVNPDVSNPYIRNIFHIRAQTEWRDNFPITLLNTIGKYTQNKELTVLGCHSDIGGGYAQTTSEKCTLHFFDLPVSASDSEKQKMEEQKKLLLNWYTSQNFYNPDNSSIKWEVKHHVISFPNKGGIFDQKNELLDSSIMGNQTSKTIGDRTYILQKYHHQLISERILNNKLSLVYMKLMQYMALTYASVPFIISTDEDVPSSVPHSEEYKWPQMDKEGNLDKYFSLLKKAAENGWVNKENKKITYPDLLDKNKQFSVPPSIHSFIMQNFVHLSANYNNPFINAIDHLDLAYTNIPHFKNNEKFEDPPYERQNYTPHLDPRDKS